MKIKRAEKMGFCFGVAGAINLCNKIVSEKNFEGRLFILGMLVHNKNVTSDMEKKGFITLTEEDLKEKKIDLQKKDTVIIRAHGTTKEIYDILEKEKVKIYDATCVFVERIRNALVEAEKKGKKIIFIGDRNHPEVKGIVSFGKDVSIVNSLEEFTELSIDREKEYCLLTQTTLNKEVFFRIKDYIEENYKNVEIFSKICGATYERQKAVEKLANEVEMVLIVGDNKSSNSKKLYEISKSINEKSYLIQDKTELDSSWFNNVEEIGITAGASTPEEIILEIEKEIRGGHLMTNMDYNEFEALLNDYLPEEGNTGSKVAGTIASKERNFAYLDVPGQITSVRVRAEEVADFNIGDEIEVMLLGETSDGEFIIGSRRKIEMEQGWEKIKEAFEKKEEVTGKVVKEVKGGYIVEIFAHQVFLPKSLSETKKDENIVGETVKLLVKDIKEDKKGKKVTVSRKDITMMQADKEFAELKEGEVLEGVVAEILPFGVVVEIGTLRGFIHISEISWKKAEKIEGFNVGDKLEVKVIGLEPEKKNVKLSLKALVRNPWDIAAETLAVDSVVEGKVTKILQYGILVEVMEGVEGLIHISDFTWNRKKINVNEFAKVGDVIKVKVLEFKPESRKLKLGMKQLSVDPWAAAEENYKVGTKLTGKVAEIKPYGVFVEIEEGIDVFIHQSDFAWVGSKKFTKGDTVEFEVIELDLNEKKIKGSIKALEKSPWEKAVEIYKVGDVVEKPVKSILEFGMFVKLEEGIDGFIPTQLASKDFIKNLKDKFQVGDVVRGKVVEIDREKQRIKISVKGLELDEEKRETKELIEKYGVSSTEE